MIGRFYWINQDIIVDLISVLLPSPSPLATPSSTPGHMAASSQGPRARLLRLGAHQPLRPRSRRLTLRPRRIMGTVPLSTRDVVHQQRPRHKPRPFLRPGRVSALHGQVGNLVNEALTAIKPVAIPNTTAAPLTPAEPAPEPQRALPAALFLIGLLGAGLIFAAGVVVQRRMRRSAGAAAQGRRGPLRPLMSLSLGRAFARLFRPPMKRTAKYDKIVSDTELAETLETFSAQSRVARAEEEDDLNDLEE